MGQSKQLLPLGNKPLIRHCLDTILESGIKDIVVVLSEERSAITDALTGYPIKRRFNSDPQSDMAESVRIGLRATDELSSGCMICLSDHPMVSSKTMRTLIELHAEDTRRIIIPVFRGKRGHPTLFPMPVIRGVFEGQTLRDIIRDNAGIVENVAVEDKGIIIDIDTMEDYESASKQVRFLPKE